jgi:hypothetical protein
MENLLKTSSQIITSLKNEYDLLINKTLLLIKFNLTEPYISELSVEYMTYKEKLLIALKLIQENIIKAESNRKIINQRQSIEVSILSSMSSEKRLLNKLHDINKVLTKYKNISKVHLNEKTILQSVSSYSKSYKQPTKPNQFQEQFLFYYPNEHFEVKESSLFIASKRCFEAIIEPDSEFVSKGEVCIFKYPDSEEKEEVFFMYLLFFENEDNLDFSNKFPSFCNGIRYDNKGFAIEKNCTLKVVSCSKYMTDSLVVTKHFRLNKPNFGIIPDTPKQIGLRRVGLDIVKDKVNNGNVSFHHNTDVNEYDNTPQGTDGSFYNGSIYKRNSYMYEDDDGI